jgi:predicted transcriptional regulator
MTKLLEQTIERLRHLSENLQDSAARALISQLGEEPEPGDLEDIKKGREDFARGDFVTLEEWQHEMGLSDR